MNGYGNSVFLRTAWEVSSGGSAPANTVAPVISGTQVVGSTLTSTTGTWTGIPAPTFTYQWFRGATLIVGATSSTYVLIQAEAGNTSNITCKVTGTNAFGNATATSNTLAQIFDFDANAFITSATITNTTQKAATNSLTIDLKGYNVWTKMKALYPMVGSTASQQKFNLKDPRDLDAAFRLQFLGGWTHSVNGATPNGTNAYADTKLIPSTSLATNSAHFSKYNITNDLAGIKADGVISGSNASFFQQNFTSANGIIGEITSLVSYTQTDSRGLFTTTRTATNVLKVFKNSTQQGSTNTATVTAIPLQNVYIGARNSSGTATDFYNSYQCAFASIGDGLTDTEANNFYIAVQNFQTTLGRQV